jgi:hypothetical protein
MSKQRFPLAVAAAAFGLALGGCATDSTSSAASGAAATTPTAAAKNYFIIVPESGRHYIFGDAKLYKMFLAHGEVALTRTRVGAGPKGETLVFAITKDHVKKKVPSEGELVFDKKVDMSTGPFYGEVYRDGRFRVFGEWKDLQDYLAHNEVILTHTRVGEGPKGETVIFALNKKTVKQGVPNALIAQFKSLHGIN